MVFDYDPHCPEKFYTDPAYPHNVIPPVESHQATYRAGACVWTDLDCDACTGNDGTDYVLHWQVGTPLPPSPTARVLTRGSTATIEWDNLPEFVCADPTFGPTEQFGGYKLYRLDNWHRSSILPPPQQWQRIGVWTPFPSLGSHTLESIRTGSGYRVNDTQLNLGFGG